MNAEHLARALGGRKSGSGYIACCVAHDDKNPSMTIADGDKGVVVKCHAGCDQRELMHVLMSRGLWPEKKGNGGSEWRIEKTYDYVDADGVLVFQVVRYEGKKFRQRRPDGAGGWSWTIKGVKKLPYRLPEVLEAIKASTPIFVVEGEKDADTMRSRGYVATCNSGGAGKWTDEHSKWLKGADVIVIPDSDEPGRKHADMVVQSLNGIATTRELTLNDGKDVTEFFEKGGTDEDLRSLLANYGVDPDNALLRERERREVLDSTEMELAASFAKAGKGSLLYVAGMDWFANSGPRWVRDEKLARFTLANRLCRAAGDLAEMKMKARIEAAKTASAIVNIARPDLIAIPADFDCVPTDLNTPDGVVDLRYGSMRKRSDGDRYMHCAAVSPDARGIRGTVFAEFLDQITCGDRALAQFLQAMLGASLFASNAIEDHWLAFLVGEGRNGKGTLIEKCASRAMGTYARRIPSEVLLADDRGTRHPTEIANLVGARLAYASEIDEGRRWNESRLKELSGGDKLSGRFMRQDLFEFTPTHRLVIYANHRPLIANPDPAFRARLKLVPFKASFVGREDTSLPDRMAEELPRILGWMVAGAAAFWEDKRLRSCPAVDEASESYFEHHATFDAWLNERCRVDPTLEERAKTLYADFKAWKQDRGEGVPSQTRWGETMAAKFGRRVSNGVIWCGLGLRP